MGARASANRKSGALAWVVACLSLLPAATACGGKSRLSAGSGTMEAPEHLTLLDDMEPDEWEVPEMFTWGSEVAGRWWNGDRMSTGLVASIVPAREASTSGLRGSTLSAILLFPHFTPVGPLDDTLLGLVFYARFEGANGQLVVAMNNWATSTSPSLTFSVSPEWQRFELSFDELSPTWDRQATSIDFVASAHGEPFVLWLDDVSFVCSGECSLE